MKCMETDDMEITIPKGLNMNSRACNAW
jgi:hypothetical protein